MKKFLLAILLLAGLLPASAYTDLDTGMRVFLTRDPAGFVDGPNLYTYVQQNPWTKFDPEGLDEQSANALNNAAAQNQAQADQHAQQASNEPLRTSINSENDEFFHMVGDILSSAWHNLTAKTDRTAAALVKNDPNPGVSAKTALVSSAYAVADSDPVGSNLYKAGEGFSGGSYFEPSTGKLQLDTPQQAAGHLETAGLSFGLELGTAYLGGEVGTALKTPAGGSVTAGEDAAIQAIADKYSTTVDVVGSRAAGKGNNIYSDLPVGHDEILNRSDIDFRIDASHPQVDDLVSELQNVGRGAGSASTRYSTTARPTSPPFIRYTPTPTQ